MIRALAAGLLALALTAPALAADRPVRLTLDGRPVDRAGGSAVLRNGVVYGDLRDLVKAYSALVTYQGSAAVVTFNAHTLRFTPGSRTVQDNMGSRVMRAAPFRRDGDLFVPLDAFVTGLHAGRVRYNARKSRADILVDANPIG